MRHGSWLICKLLPAFWYQSGVVNFGSGLQYLLWQCLPDPWWSVYYKSMRQRCHIFVMSKRCSYKMLQTIRFFSFKLVSPTIFCWYRTRPQVLIACVGTLGTHRFFVLRWTGFDDVPLVPNLRSCYFSGMNPSHTAIRGNFLKFSVVMAVYLKRCHGLNWSVQIPKQSYIESTHVYYVPHCSTNLSTESRHQLGYVTESMDFRYTSAMDFNSNGGFSFLVNVYLGCMFSNIWYFFDASCLRLCLYSILNQVPSEGLSLFAPDCSSWGVPCRHTSGEATSILMDTASTDLWHQLTGW